jgi:hypothetical protein
VGHYRNRQSPRLDRLRPVHHLRPRSDSKTA